jgi:predicted transcriptional regulator
LGRGDLTTAILAKDTDRESLTGMGLIQLLVLLGAGATSTIFLFSANRRKRLEAAFYQLLRTQDSCVSLIQLVTIAQVNSQVAKTYLEEQAKLLNGIPEVDEEGDVFYRFPKLKLPVEAIEDDW